MGPQLETRLFGLEARGAIGGFAGTLEVTKVAVQYADVGRVDCAGAVTAHPAGELDQ